MTCVCLFVCLYVFPWYNIMVDRASKRNTKHKIDIHSVAFFFLFSGDQTKKKKKKQKKMHIARDTRPFPIHFDRVCAHRLSCQTSNRTVFVWILNTCTSVQRVREGNLIWKIAWHGIKTHTLGKRKIEGAIERYTGLVSDLHTAVISRHSENKQQKQQFQRKKCMGNREKLQKNESIIRGKTHFSRLIGREENKTRYQIGLAQ